MGTIIWHKNNTFNALAVFTLQSIPLSLFIGIYRIIIELNYKIIVYVILLLCIANKF